MFRDIQKEFDKNGPIRVPIEIGPTLTGEVFPALAAPLTGSKLFKETLARWTSSRQQSG
jgi:hypothetical protein